MQPNNTQPNAQPKPGITIRGRRFTLPWVIGAVVTALLLLSCGCCGTVGLASALNGGNGTAQATATTGNTGAQSQGTATAKPAAQPTATTAAVTGKHVLHISGAAEAMTSKSFTVHNTWVITWGCTPSRSNDLMVVVNDPSATVASSDIPTIRATCDANGSGAQTYHASGTFTLSVSGGAAWDIVVIDTLD